MRITQTPSGGGGSAKDHQYYDIVVGNAAAGDTLALCDFLDVGNGMQWKAALAAAGAAGPVRKSVFTRRGIYDLGAVGSDGLPIVVPSDVLNVCDGQSQTAILSSSNPAVTGGIAALQVDGEIWDVAVLLQNPTSVNPSAALGLVSVRDKGRVRRMRVDHDVVTVNGRLGAIASSVLYTPGAYSEDLRVENAPSASPVGFFAPHLLLPGASPGGVSLTRLIRPVVQGTPDGAQGGTIGIYSRISHLQIIEPRIVDPALAGIFVQAEEDTLTDIQITDPYIVWDYQDTVLGLARSAITMQANQVLTTFGVLDGVRVTRGFFDNFKTHANPLGSRAIQILAIGAGFASVVQNCEVIGAMCRHWDEAGHVQGTGISIVNANGIIDTDTTGNTAGVVNVNDAGPFRTGGNW